VIAAQQWFSQDGDSNDHRSFVIACSTLHVSNGAHGVVTSLTAEKIYGCLQRNSGVQRAVTLVTTESLVNACSTKYGGC